MDLKTELIQDTFEMVKPRAEEFADCFFAKLFQDYPTARQIFINSDKGEMKRVLFASLLQIVHSLENPEFLGEYLGRMGERHEASGATEEHIEWMGQTLLKTLRDMFGSEWTQEYNKQWTMTIDVVAALMRDGLRRVKGKVLPLRNAENESNFPEILPITKAS